MRILLLKVKKVYSKNRYIYCNLSNPEIKRCNKKLIKVTILEFKLFIHLYVFLLNPPRFIIFSFIYSKRIVRMHISFYKSSRNTFYS